jgi:uncharacterized protein YndB with AHSA1/START domain
MTTASGISRDLSRRVQGQTMFRQKLDRDNDEMATNEVMVDVLPARVFEVLSDASLYADWVVGAQAVRGADEEWPAPAAALEHSSGVGPLTIDDTTEVLESDPPRRLVLRANLGPVGSVRVELRLEQVGDGTRVIMEEEPFDGAGAALHNPLSDVVLRGRNALSLRRLKELAEA